MKKNQAVAVVAGTALLALGVTGPVMAAVADAPGDDGVVVEPAAMEQAADGGASLDVAYEEASRLDGFADGGWSELDGGAVEIVWRGDITSDLERVIDGAATRGVEVVVTQVGHSAAEIAAVVDHVATALDESGLAYDGIGMTDDYSGVFVEVPQDRVTDGYLDRVAEGAAGQIPVSVSSIETGWTPDGPRSATFEARAD
ncbi:hypothetical protein [Microbacterium sp.]|uniref:hypothetical protein n=1 Tax=Microbacterium sp. TaxID=51671 RepID=UPI003A8A8082